MGLFSKKHSIGKTIAELRKANGWTQVELAERINVSDKTISKWEKDNGAPSIEFLPILSEIFGVSIDYIVSGKEVEKEIVTISRLELACQKDNPKLLEGLLSYYDEYGHDLLYYIMKYKAYNVLKSLINKNNYDSLLGPGKEIDIELFKMLIIIDKEQEVMKRLFPRLDIRSIHNFSQDKFDMKSNFHNKNSIDTISSWYKSIFTLLVQDYDQLSQTQKDYYFNLNSNNSIIGSNCWYTAFPYFIHYSFKYGCNKLFNNIISRVISSNEEYIVQENNIPRYDNYKLSYFKEKNIFINLFKETVDMVYRKDKKLGFDLNKYCSNPLTTYNFYCIDIELDNKIPESEKNILKTIHDGILSVDELCSINDINIIKKILNKYPISNLEIFLNYYNTKSWGEMYRWAIDKDEIELASFALDPFSFDDATVDGKKYENEKDFIKACNNNIVFEELITRYFIKELKQNNFSTIYEMSAQLGFNTYHSSNESLVYFLLKQTSFIKIKEELINSIRKKQVDLKNVEEFDKKYFEKQLSKGNYELVIIKLCVRLEATLKTKFNYEGTFEEMLAKYCGTFNDKSIISLLNRLRIQRNSIVHSKQSYDELSVDEIKVLIEYICKL